MPEFRELVGNNLARKHVDAVAALAAERDVFTITYAVDGDMAADLCRGRVATLTPRQGAWIGFVKVLAMATDELAYLEVGAPTDLLGYEDRELGVIGSLHSLTVSRAAQVYASPARRTDGTAALVLLARVAMTGDDFRDFAREYEINIPLLSF